MNVQVLITGGSGLVGSRLSQMLLERGYQVSHLSRSPTSRPNITVYPWDIQQKKIDAEALAGADYIVHLAGARIVGQRWTKQRKQTILESRTESTQLLHDTIAKIDHHNIKAFISASAFGIYDYHTGTSRIKENYKRGNGFMAEVLKSLETKVDQMEELNIRTVKYRTGLVLSAKDGFLKSLAGAVRWKLGAPFGSGEQYVSWIHIDDLCRMYIYAIEQ